MALSGSSGLLQIQRWGSHYLSLPYPHSRLQLLEGMAAVCKILHGSCSLLIMALKMAHLTFLPRPQHMRARARVSLSYPCSVWDHSSFSRYSVHSCTLCWLLTLGHYPPPLEISSFKTCLFHEGFFYSSLHSSLRPPLKSRSAFFASPPED